ncbi:CheY-like chemotaxis protein [Sphingomonas sp. BE138]|uniref:hypothetical protein n=1 Tax=Sphingomonas sp. BE138 TaxID=2817845 RepID=UPI0028557F67|nr:hypothetical protein [Sphingomonas sp. BE138]MDR6789246.1 CheY-like chemotaxis protein [Sphingomonas sp. BE138]
MTENLKVLLIDDEASSHLLPAVVEPVLAKPNDASFTRIVTEALAHVDLVLLDHNLDLSPELSLTATDGPSLLGHLRSWARLTGNALPPVAIYTSEEEAYAAEVPAVGPAVPLAGSFVGREPQLAPVLDVEWLILKDAAFSKSTIVELAQASVRLKTVAGNGRVSAAELAAYLCLPENALWNVSALEQLVRSRPPLTEPGKEGSDGSRGVAGVLRWILHRILPYPGLLMSDQYAAWTLGVGVDDLDNLLIGDKDFNQDLATCVFKGPVANVFGRRWWAAGLNFMAWTMRSAVDEASDEAVALEQLTGTPINIRDSSGRVVGHDPDLREDEFIDLDDAVQLHPPGWPAEAIEPWIRRSEAQKEPLIWAMVDPADKQEGE